jgi:site-specific recombinase XerC
VANLSDVSIRALPTPEKGQKLYCDGAVEGLYVRVSQGGSKTFVLVLGSERRFTTIGRYGDVTLADARTAARKVRAGRTLGRILPTPMSLSEAREQYLSQLDVRVNTRAYYERNLKRLKGSKLSDITPSEINRILDALSRSSRDQALASLRAFFKWCIRRHYLEKSPCESMSLSPLRSRSRVLADDELRHLWEATEQPTVYNRIVRTLALCGQRPRETAAFHATWMKGGEITIPPEVAKNGREHTFPVGVLALSIIRASQRDGLFFPARAKAKTAFKGWSKSKRKLDKKLADKVGPWQLRDLRRTFRTIHARIKTPPHIAERLINHVSSTPELQRIYDRYEYMDEMRTAVENYERFFQTLIAPIAMRNAAIIDQKSATAKAA